MRTGAGTVVGAAGVGAGTGAASATGAMSGIVSTTGSGAGGVGMGARGAAGSPLSSGSGTGETSGRTNGIEHPTTTLGVDDDADWKTIRAAHRKLLAQLHPDRFVTADERTRQEAADRLAAINIAYHELERTRRAV